MPSVDVHTKKCSRCKKVKEVSDFPQSVKSVDGFGKHCAACCEYNNAKSLAYRSRNRRALSDTARLRHLQISYKLTEQQYDELLTQQGGVCAICGKSEMGKFRGQPKRMAVDHDHKTGKVRGLLCSPCNHGLGSFKDDPELLLAAIEYLK